MDAFLSFTSRLSGPAQAAAVDEPLLGPSAPPSPMMERVLRSTPHAVMAFGHNESYSDKLEKAQELLGELRKQSFSEDGGSVTGESVLLAALEAFLESQGQKPAL